MRNIVAISGVPGTGKTTLIRKFMEAYKWEKVEPLQLVPALYCEELNLYILGKYEEDEIFAGTDKMSMACQPKVCEFIESTNANILYEGDRLTGMKFYDFLLDLPDTNVRFLVIETDDETLQERYKERGSNQSETFLKGRVTKIDNILSSLVYMSFIDARGNKNIEDQTEIVKYLNDIFND